MGPRVAPVPPLRASSKRAFTSPSGETTVTGPNWSSDRAKSAAHYLGRFNDPTRQSFWNCFGLDQLVHHFTHYFIIYSLVTVEIFLQDKSQSISRLMNHSVMS